MASSRAEPSVVEKCVISLVKVGVCDPKTSCFVSKFGKSQKSDSKSDF